jgi:hypothetical protein
MAYTSPALNVMIAAARGSIGQAREAVAPRLRRATLAVRP